MSNVLPFTGLWKTIEIKVVCPVLDSKDHEWLNEKCACKPFWKSDNILVHNAFDGRE